jgi:hypothetical protein
MVKVCKRSATPCWAAGCSSTCSCSLLFAHVAWSTCKLSRHRATVSLGTEQALAFVADFIVAGRAAVAQSVAVRILEHLVRQPLPGRPGTAAAAHESSTLGQRDAPAATAAHESLTLRQRDGSAAALQPPAPLPQSLGEGLGPAATAADAAGAAVEGGEGVDARRAQREERFVAVMMTCGLAGDGHPPQWVIRRVLALAKQAGFLQAQAQVNPVSPIALHGCEGLSLITSRYSLRDDVYPGPEHALALCVSR